MASIKYFILSVFLFLSIFSNAQIVRDSTTTGQHILFFYSDSTGVKLSEKNRVWEHSSTLQTQIIDSGYTHVVNVSANNWYVTEIDSFIIGAIDTSSTYYNADYANGGYLFVFKNVPRSYYSNTAVDSLLALGNVVSIDGVLTSTDSILWWYANYTPTITYHTIDLWNYDARTSASDTDKATIIANYNDLSVNDPAGSSFPIADADIILLYEFDETNGTTAYDAVNSYDGTIYNSPSLGVTGKLGTAYQMVAANSQWIDVPLQGALTDFSISAWIYIPSTTTGIKVFKAPNGIGSTSSFGLAYSTSSNRFYIQSAGGYRYGDYHVTEDAWNHVVVTYDSENDVLKIYTNNDTPTESTSYAITYGTDSNAAIGERFGTEFSDATFDQFILINRVITAQEVSDLNNSGNGIAHN